MLIQGVSNFFVLPSVLVRYSPVGTLHPKSVSVYIAADGVPWLIIGWLVTGELWPHSCTDRDAIWLGGWTGQR